ncbi:hypothetical protein GN244_ATG02683 [Phytophthora infestans]|uniref:Uncharacterized protein n=1 Tax=Phytophthora infestans TaxID=4787 RepID=A0A833X102_PHYIN|nr:hypothetical protein GN244_ATG02683 [Phytophthora infestans]
MKPSRSSSGVVQFSAAFGAAVSLPATDSTSSTYVDQLAAIGGLIAFGDALWFDYVRCLQSGLKRFVVARMERDSNTRECVNLTLLHANQFTNDISRINVWIRHTGREI